MLARALLPDLGGAPVVWNTCMVFFQLLLLCGYSYAHVTSRRMTPARQCGMHLILLMLPPVLFALALGRHGSPLAIWPGLRDWLSPAGHPIVGMLGILGLTAGLPCLVLSASSPLLQRWYAGSGASRADDPYFLYAASNLGSLTALVSYTLVLEPYTTRQEQSWIWCGGYVLYAVLTTGCAVALGRSRPGSVETRPRPKQPSDRRPEAASAVTFGRRARWLALSAAPASLLLGVTGFVTTDIAAVPLLWVIPLLLYLLSFVIAFARRRFIPHRLVIRYLPLTLIIWGVTMVLQATEPASVLLGVHLFVFFWTALACHGELHRDRPALDAMTGFYLIVSIGGVAGGILNAFVAPMMFNGFVEYPLAMVAAFVAATWRPGDRTTAPAMAPTPQRALSRAASAMAAPVLAGLLVLSGCFVLDRAGLSADRAVTDMQARFLRGSVYALPLVCCIFWSARSIPFALGIGTVLLVVPLVSGLHGRVLYVERTLFGVHRVTVDSGDEFHLLVHGNTEHGRQRWSPEPAARPGSYYHPDGPAGDIFMRVGGNANPSRIAVVGLGAGSLAYYGRNQPEQHWTFYEIDPAVVGIARNPHYFTFLSESFPESSRLQIVVGDARLRLAEAPDGQFNVVIFDAFSSDSIPVHLLTSEAIRLYVRKLAPDGFLVFHISNRYLDLGRLLAALAESHDERLVVFERNDAVGGVTEQQTRDGKQPSQWVVMARPSAEVDWLPVTWRKLSADPRTTAWTDEYANILGVVKSSFWPALDDQSPPDLR